MKPGRRLARYLLRRLLLTIPTLLVVALFVFVLVRLIPGDPAEVMLGEAADANALAAMHRDFGFDQPVWIQFLRWLARAATGDLGISVTTGLPVSGLIWDRFLVTASIVVTAIALALVVAVVTGLAAAVHRGRALDGAIVWISAITMAIPSFWLGLMLILGFGVRLGWLPVVGYVPLGENLRAGATFLLLPVATLAIVESGVLVRMMRASAIDTLRLDFVTHARAKGLPEHVVLLRHVLPNAFAPTMTLAGLAIGHLLGGAAVVETVFTLPGLGRLMVDAVLGRDYPVVQGCLLFTAVVYLVVNLLVDLLYPLLDPRVVLDA